MELDARKKIEEEIKTLGKELNTELPRALKIAVAMMLQRYRLAVVPGSRIDRAVHVTMSPSRGLPMEIHPPDGRFHPAPVRGQIRDMVDLPVG